MQEIPSAPSPASLLRWATFIFVVACTMFIISYGRLQDFASVTAMAGPTVANLSPLLVVALPGALLAGGFLLFYFVALWPRPYHVPIYNQLVFPIVAIFLFAAVFVVALRLRMYGWCSLLLVAGVFVSARMFVRVAPLSPSRHSRLLRVPFSLCLAMLTVATIATGSYWLAVSGIPRYAIHPDPLWLPIGGALVVAIGAGLAIRYHEFVYPLVVAVIAAVAAQVALSHDPGVVTGMVVVCAGMLLVSVLAAFASTRDPRARRRGPHRYALEQLREASAIPATAARPPTTARRNRKIAKASSAWPKGDSRQPLDQDTGPFQGSPTIS